MKNINIVLVNPEIPQNTGNISRTCAVTGAALHIIRPTGFVINDKNLKRAGLDYWDKLDITYYDGFEEFYEINKEYPMYFFSSHGEKNYAEVDYPETVFLCFGRETHGLDEWILQEHKETVVRIPMLPTLRCLNLSNAVAIATYEVLRQRGFDGFV